MRYLILGLIVTSLSAVQAAPIAGSSPAQHGHIETSLLSTLGGDRFSVSAIGRLGLTTSLDAGLALGLGMGSRGGMTVGVPARMLWGSPKQLKKLLRFSSDAWLAMNDSGKVLRTIAGKTVSASHRNRLFGTYVELRLSVGATAMYEDKPDLEDDLAITPTALIAVSGFEYRGFNCSVEGGLRENSGRLSVEIALEF